jgi:hypothetical protein
MKKNGCGYPLALDFIQRQQNICTLFFRKNRSSRDNKENNSDKEIKEKKEDGKV